VVISLARKEAGPVVVGMSAAILHLVRKMEFVKDELVTNYLNEDKSHF